MAKVKLSEYECRKDLLPHVCAQCGQPASVTVRRKFSWHPPWVLALVLVALVVAAIVALILTKRMVVQMPMCDRHKDHWSKRTLWTLLTFGVVVVIGIAGVVFLNQQKNQAGGDLSGIVCGAGVVALIAWLVLVVVFQSALIKPNEITDESITLVKVHPEFVAALEEDRARDEDEDPRRPRLRNARRTQEHDDYDDEAIPRRKRNNQNPRYNDE